jgi:hypothetical protein
MAPVCEMPTEASSFSAPGVEASSWSPEAWQPRKRLQCRGELRNIPVAFTPETASKPLTRREGCPGRTAGSEVVIGPAKPRWTTIAVEAGRGRNETPLGRVSHIQDSVEGRVGRSRSRAPHAFGSRRGLSHLNRPSCRQSIKSR